MLPLVTSILGGKLKSVLGKGQRVWEGGASSCLDRTLVLNTPFALSVEKEQL